MDIMHDAVIVVGLSSVALLWVFSVVGAMQVVWDTFGDHLDGVIRRTKK